MLLEEGSGELRLDRDWGQSALGGVWARSRGILEIGSRAAGGERVGLGERAALSFLLLSTPWPSSRVGGSKHVNVGMLGVRPSSSHSQDLRQALLTRQERWLLAA